MLGRALPMRCAGVLLLLNVSLSFGEILFQGQESFVVGHEGNGEVQMSVSRRGDLSARASVEFNVTFNGILATDDFLKTSGTIQFEPAATNALFSLPIRRDGLVEGMELFQVTLSNPLGDTLTRPQKASLLLYDAEKPVTTDPSFQPIMSNNTFHGAVVLEDGTVLVAGAFQEYAGPIIPLNKLSPSGMEDLSFMTSGFDFAVDELLDGRELEDGSLVLAGTWYVSGGRASLLRLKADGQRDNAYALQPDFLFIGFGRGGEALVHDHQKVLRLDQDGAIDPSFNAFVPGGYIEHGMIQPDGKILLLSRTAEQSGIARFTAEGAPDLAFKPITGPSSGITAFRLAGNDVVASGTFSTNEGQFISGIATFDANGERIAYLSSATGPLNLLGAGSEGVYVAGTVSGRQGCLRLTSSLTLDPSFVSDTGVSLIVHGGSGLFVAHDFGSYGRVFEKIYSTNATLTQVEFASKEFASPESSTGVVILRRIGDLSHSTDVEVNATAAVEEGIAFSARSAIVHFEPLQSEASISWFLGGDELPARDQVVQLSIKNARPAVLGVNSNAVLRIVDDDWRPGSLATGMDDKWIIGGINGIYGGSRTSDLVRLPSGKVFVVGVLVNPDAPAKLPSSFLIFNQNGRLDEAAGWLPYQGSHVYRAAAQSSGKIIVVGDHYFYPWSVARYLPDGSLDTTFERVPISAHEVRNVIVQPDDKILIHGLLQDTTLPDDRRSHNFMRLLPDGLKDTSFTVAPEVSWVQEFGLQPDGKVLLFCLSALGTNVLGLRLNTDGSLDGSFTPITDAFYLTEMAMAFGTNGKVVIAYTGPLSDRFMRTRVRRLDQNGVDDPTFALTGGIDGPVTRMLVLPDGKTIVMGGFTTIGGLKRPGLARLNADGSVDAGFDCGSGAAVRVALLLDNGDLLVGGAFDRFNGMPRVALAQIKGSLQPSFRTLSKNGNSFTAALIGDSGQDFQLESSDDLRSWQPAGSLHLEQYSAGFSSELNGTKFFRARLQAGR